MEEVNIVLELVKVAPVAGVLGWWVYSLKQEIKELRVVNNTQAEDYKNLAENAIKIIALADDKLSKDSGNDEKIKDIHRMVEETLEIVRRHVSGTN